MPEQQQSRFLALVLVHALETTRSWRAAKGTRPRLFAEQDIGFDLADTGQGHDASSENSFEVADIARHDPQSIIVEAQHVMHRLHLGDRGDRTFEIRKTDTPFGRELHTKKYRDTKAQFLEINVQPVAN